MEYYDIRGGDVPQGEVTPSGNKNEALPVLAAALLAERPVTLRNLPDIIDVNVMLALLEDLGAKVWPARSPHGDHRSGGAHRQAAQSRALREGSGPRSSSRARCWRVRQGRAAASRRRRHRPPPGGHPLPGAGASLAPRYRGTTGYTIEAQQLIGADIFLDEPTSRPRRTPDGGGHWPRGGR